VKIEILDSYERYITCIYTNFCCQILYAMDVNYLDGIYVQMGDGSFKTSNACGLGNLIIGKTMQLCKGRNHITCTY
jgi:hypothetical protein